MVELQSTWSGWSLTAALQLLPPRPMARLQAGSVSCSRGHCSNTTILQLPHPPAGRYPAAGVGLKLSSLDIDLY